MSLGFGKNRKSPPLARLLSHILPGLGHIYAGNIFAGIMWMFFVAVPFIWFFIYLIQTDNIGYALFPLTCYFCLGIFAANNASRLTVEQNSQQAFKERIGSK